MASDPAAAQAPEGLAREMGHPHDGALTFQDVMVDDVMTPLDAVFALPADAAENAVSHCSSQAAALWMGGPTAKSGRRPSPARRARLLLLQ